ncbi:MAG: hypothetical protein WBA57_18465 [Elainellaceae cyanobacterium]
MGLLRADARTDEQLSLFDSPAPVDEAIDIEARAKQLADEFIQDMEKEGLDHTAQQQLLMRLQIRTLVDRYLVRIPPCQRWQFAVQLIDGIQQLESQSEGF